MELGPISETKGNKEKQGKLNKETKRKYRRKMKKIGFIVLAVVLALGLVGVGYAAWSQTLNVGVVAKTGSLSAVFGGSTTSGTPDNGVSTWSTTGQGTTTLNISIANAYPGENFVIPFTVNNTGTIPANVTMGTWTDTTVGTNPVTENPYADDVVISTWNAPTSPIAVGGYATDGSLTVSVGPNAAMNGTYTLTATIVVSQ